ncbi:hypothetical protein AC249_AIPGENE16718 [Exaiptasia diaphana]|nr:hypothetical protein AC249_AIPGENE16718 [Exaiptasia diaphana]
MSLDQFDVVVPQNVMHLVIQVHHLRCHFKEALVKSRGVVRPLAKLTEDQFDILTNVLKSLGVDIKPISNHLEIPLVEGRAAADLPTNLGEDGVVEYQPPEGQVQKHPTVSSQDLDRAVDAHFAVLDMEPIRMAPIEVEQRAAECQTDDHQCSVCHIPLPFAMMDCWDHAKDLPDDELEAGVFATPASRNKLEIANPNPNPPEVPGVIATPDESSRHELETVPLDVLVTPHRRRVSDDDTVEPYPFAFRDLPKEIDLVTEHATPPNVTRAPRYDDEEMPISRLSQKVDDDSDDDVPLSLLKRKRPRKVIEYDDDDEHDDDTDNDMDDDSDDERVEESDSEGQQHRQQPLAGVMGHKTTKRVLLLAPTFSRASKPLPPNITVFGPRPSYGPWRQECGVQATAPTASVCTQIFEANPLLMAQPPPVVAAVQPPAVQPPAYQPPHELSQPAVPAPAVPAPAVPAPTPSGVLGSAQFSTTTYQPPHELSEPALSQPAVPAPAVPAPAVPAPTPSGVLGSAQFSTTTYQPPHELSEPAVPAPAVPAPTPSGVLGSAAQFSASSSRKLSGLLEKHSKKRRVAQAEPDSDPDESDTLTLNTVPPSPRPERPRSVVYVQKEQLSKSDEEELDDYITDAEEENDLTYTVSDEEEKEEESVEVPSQSSTAASRQRSSFVLPDINNPLLTPYDESLAAFYQHLLTPHGSRKMPDIARADIINEVPTEVPGVIATPEAGVIATPESSSRPELEIATEVPLDVLVTPHRRRVSDDDAVEPYPFLSHRATPKVPNMLREPKLRLQLAYTHLVFKTAKESHLDNLAEYARDQWKFIRKE